MAYVKIENGIVIQKQPNQEEGFIEVDDNVVCGQIFSDGEFSNPVPELNKPQQLAAYRYTKEVGGLDLGGGAIANTKRDGEGGMRVEYLAARTGAKENTDFVIELKLNNNQWITLNAEQTIAAVTAIFNHINNCFLAEAAVSRNINNYDTIEDIQAAFDEAYAAN